MSSLAEWLAYQERTHSRSIDLGLERVAQVARVMQLERPPFPVITVAGTNGKGSTVAFTEALLGSGGLLTGAFTSPHLLRYNERVRVGGATVSDAELVAAFERIETARHGTSLTFFEYSTLAALEIFMRRGVEAAVLEVGLGGRLDATNLLDADVAVVTSIGLDHCEWLGETLEAIGREKAGIFRHGRPAVLGSAALPGSVRSVAGEVGAQVFAAGCEFRHERHAGGWRYRSADLDLDDLPSPGLTGEVQYDNAATALAALECLARGFEPVRRCLAPQRAAAALAATRLPGRFQILAVDGIEWVLDVAHNEAAARVLAGNLARRPRSGRSLGVCGILRDKDAAAIVRALAGQIDEWLLCTLEGARGLTATELRERLPPGLPASVATSVPAALEAARARARPGDRIVVFGSFHTVGPALGALGLY